MTSRPLPAAAAAWAGAWPAAVRGTLRQRLRGERALFTFTLSAVSLNAATLLGNALAFRWIDPASMGVWHTLLLAGSYATVVRGGVVNGLGRELPFALGQGDALRARRIVQTALACSVASSALVGVAFLVPLAWVTDDAWRLGLVATALVSVGNLYLTYLQATFRSNADFARLARVQQVQAALALLMPAAVYALRFRGLCLHAALQSLVVAGFAHAVRPFHARPRFERRLALELLATGLPLFVAAYLQVLAAGFDRVILLRRGGVAAVGYYAPAVAVLGALSVVPGAVAAYVYPRMSYALGRGRSARSLGRMALVAATASVAAGLPLALAGWLAAPPGIERFFPRYLPSVPAVRWSLVAGVLWSLAPAATLLGSLKAWRSLSLYVTVLLATRWSLPWLLSGRQDPLLGVARGNACAAAVVGALSLFLALRAMRQPAVEAAA